MKEKLKNLVVSTKAKVMVGTALIGTTVMTVSASAAEVVPPTYTAPTIEWGTMGQQILSYFNSASTALLPVGAIIFGAMLAYSFGPKIVKKFTGR